MEAKVFPLVIDDKVRSEGLTKRELFAAMAMQGVLGADLDNTYSPETIAQFSVKHADSLIEALEDKKAP